MFDKIKQRFRDMRTISALCLGAEKHANADGQKEPGAEHFVLAALELPDGTARKALERLHVNPNNYRAAIAQQYEEALKSVGITLPPGGATRDDTLAVPCGKGIYQAQASAQALMQRLAKQHQADTDTPLLGAHVLQAIAAAQYGVAVRALRAAGADLALLAEAATAEINAWKRA